MSDRIYDQIVSGWPTDELSRFRPEHFKHRFETGSTNDDLLSIARSGNAKPFELISADFQSSGRGRRGDRWESGPGRNLLFSLALPLTMEREHWSRLPHLTAYIAGSAIEGILGPGHKLQAKWPNDLLYRGRKLAGILVEIAMAREPVAVVGIGINVNLRREDLPPELREVATSIYEILECESSRWFLLGLIVQGFLRNYPGHLEDFGSVLEWIRQRDSLNGKSLRLRTGLQWIEGIATGLGEDGQLLLRAKDKSCHEIVSAEQIIVD